MPIAASIPLPATIAQLRTIAAPARRRATRAESDPCACSRGPIAHELRLIAELGSQAHAMNVPVQAVLDVLRAGNPMTFSGAILQASE